MWNKKQISNWLITRNEKDTVNKERSSAFLEINDLISGYSVHGYYEFKQVLFSKLEQLNQEKKDLQKLYAEDKSEESLQKIIFVGAKRCTYNEVYAYLLVHKPVL